MLPFCSGPITSCLCRRDTRLSPRIRVHVSIPGEPGNEASIALCKLHTSSVSEMICCMLQFELQFCVRILGGCAYCQPFVKL